MMPEATPTLTPNPYGGRVWGPASRLASHGGTFHWILARDFIRFAVEYPHPPKRDTP